MAKVKVSWVVAGVMGLAVAAGLGPATRPGDLVQGDTTWTGAENGGDQKDQNKDRYAEMKITDRKDGDFHGTYEMKMGGNFHRLTFEGKVNDKGDIAIKPTKIGKGAAWDENVIGSVWMGTVAGDTIKLERKNQHNQVIKITLTTSGEEPSEGRRKKRK